MEIEATFGEADFVQKKLLEHMNVVIGFTIFVYAPYEIHNGLQNG